MAWFLSHSLELNLGVCIAQMLLGAGLGLLSGPDLALRRFGQWAFGFWTSQWLFATLAYIVLVRYPSHQVLFLSLIDVQNLVVLASGATLLLAEPMKIARTLLILGVLVAGFTCYNLLFNPWGDHSSASFLLWALPSQTLSVFSWGFIGVAACLRYRRYGFPFLLASVVYSGCQPPLYAATLLKTGDIGRLLQYAAPWFLAVAVLKLLLGVTFYSSSFLVFATYDRLISADQPTMPERISKPLLDVTKWILSFVLFDVGLAILAAWLVGRLWGE